MAGWDEAALDAGCEWAASDEEAELLAASLEDAGSLSETESGSAASSEAAAESAGSDTAELAGDDALAALDAGSCTASLEPDADSEAAPEPAGRAAAKPTAANIIMIPSTTAAMSFCVFFCMIRQMLPFDGFSAECCGAL